jgi:hypothetical protein
VIFQASSGKDLRTIRRSDTKRRKHLITNMKPAIFIVAVSAVLFSCSHRNTPSGTEDSQALSSSPVNYSPRVGIAVRTPSRTCIAIQNAALQPGKSLVIVSPLPPQSYFEAQIKGPSPSPCPITQDIQPGISSYEIEVPPGSAQVSPMFAVLANAPVLHSVGNIVQSDLDQNGKTQNFRVCSSNDGVHLTLWSGQPLEGRLLWHGYYYEASNPGMSPQYMPRELSGP